MSPRLKQLYIGIAVLLLVAVSISLVIPWLVDANKRKEEISHFLQSSYGLTFEAVGEASVSAFPAPEIIYEDAAIKDAEGNIILHTPMLKIQIGWTGLFSQTATTATLLQPESTLSYAEVSNALGALTSASGSTNASLPTKIIFNNGTLKIHGSNEKESTSYQQVNATLNIPMGKNPFKFSASAILHNKPFGVEVYLDPYKSHQATLDFTLNQASTIKFAGELNPANTSMWGGSIEANISDIGELSAFLTGGDNSTKIAIPLVFNGKAELDNNSLTLKRTNALIHQKNGAFAAYIGWSNTLSMAFELNAEQLDMKQFIEALGPSILPKSINQNIGVAPLVVNYSADTNVYLLLHTDIATFDQKKYKKLNISAELDEGNLILHHGNIRMPGETEINIKGAMTQQPEGRRFSGTAKIVGKHLNTWLADFEPNAENLPPEDFSAFALEGNLFISAEQLRLSEARLVINQFELLGGFATYFEKMPRVEAEIKLKNANLDYFRDAWREETSTANDNVYQILIGNKTRFDWLKRLPAILDLNIAIDGFRFLDNDGQLATMRFYATPGEMSLYGIDARFLENTLSGNVKLNVLGDRPKLNVVLTTNQFDTEYFDSTTSSQSVPWFDPKNTEKRWSEKLFDVRWMNSLDGGIDLSVGKLKHNGQTYAKFKWRADLDNTTMNIQKLSFDYLGGTFDLNGTFIGGKVPGLSASFALYNADLQVLLSRFLNADDITGRISVTGVASTSGIHMKSWVEQGDMKLTAVARGVRVKNLNLQSVVDTTSAARSTQDVAEGVRNLVFDGTTEASVDGNINFQQGVVKTPGIRLVSERISGNLTGELQLLPWTLNLTTQWQFPELSSTTIPTMSISQQGGINDYTTRMDTSSLEAFVAKRIISQ